MGGVVNAHALDADSLSTDAESGTKALEHYGVSCSIDFDQYYTREYYAQTIIKRVSELHALNDVNSSQ